MKRSHGATDEDLQADPRDASDAEMVVLEGEEKVVDREEEDDDDDEESDEEEAEVEADKPIEPVHQENPFLDSFYGISSADVSERTRAAQVCLHHCLLGPDANAKDAAYALTRLLNGLCSGRAAARQGNASTLASFLKVAFALGKMEEIRREQQSKSDVSSSEELDVSELSDLAYVRYRLRTATEPGGETQGRKKNAEERDSQFGRLFGINGIVRSGILVPRSKTSLDEIQQVTSDLMSDLAALYGHKKWIREPAAHAVCTLLNMLYAVCPGNADAPKVVEHIVEGVVVPQLLTKGDNEREGESNMPLFATYSAEQIGIGVNIQAHANLLSTDLPAPIDKPILTSETLSTLAPVLSETSAVTQPRTHLFWDAMWSFISESDETNNAGKIDTRKMRKDCPVSKESVDNLLGAVMKHVVIEKLLCISDGGDSKSSGKATHERRALALCIVRNLSGVEFVSSLAGRMRLVVPAETLENFVFSSTMVRRLFLDVICTGQQKKQSAHLLKPLALEVLELVSQSLTETSGDSTPSEECLNRRLAVVKALLVCEPRFDARTKTPTIETLLHFGQNDSSTETPMALWTRYLSFLEEQIAMPDQGSSGVDISASHFKVVGYIDLMFQLGKRLTRMKVEDSGKAAEFKDKMLTRIFGFLMSIAFFDCSGVVEEGDQMSSSKKKKKKQRQIASGQSSVVRSALMIQEYRKGKTSTVSFESRSVASARFHSLVTDVATSKAHSSTQDRESYVLEFISGLHKIKSELEKAGAKQLASVHLDDQMQTDDVNSETAVSLLMKDATLSMNVSQVRKRWASACALLATTLYLHLLSCGRPESALEDDDPDADDEEDHEEITSMIADVHHVSKLLSSSGAPNEDDNPLAALSELCVNILSSPLTIGNQSRGASPTMFREVVKMAWTSGLHLAASESNISLDSGVVNILLNAIGAIGEESAGDEDMDEDEGDSESDDGYTDGDSDQGVFAQAAEEAEVNDKDIDDDSGNSKSSAPLNSAEEDSELELDPTKLRSLLEEGSDAEIDEGELEHHEGADAALAKLIQLKHEARKAGQLARERREIARQIRCILLIETLVLGKAETWGSLLRVDLVLQMVLSLMQYRSELAKHLRKAAQKGTSVGLAEKRALLDRLTSLIKAKVLKAKVSDLDWSDDVDISQYSNIVAERIFVQAKESVDKEHPALCNSAFLFMIRAITDTDSKLEKASMYTDAVSEWSTKRTSRLEASFFEALIHQNPVLAQACLCMALASAVSNARSSFLRSESLRLLSLLYNPNLNPNKSNMDHIAFEQMLEAVDRVLLSASACLKDADMLKAKRVREVLKTLEKMFLFLLAAEGTLSPNAEHFVETKELVKKLQADSDSKGVNNLSEKLLKTITEFEEKAQSRDEAKKSQEKETNSKNAASPAKSSEALKHKKSKKQKSKKRRR